MDFKKEFVEFYKSIMDIFDSRTETEPNLPEPELSSFTFL